MLLVGILVRVHTAVSVLFLTPFLMGANFVKCARAVHANGKDGSAHGVPALAIVPAVPLCPVEDFVPIHSFPEES